MSDTEGQEDTSLHEAVRYADETDVKDALRNGCDPNLIGLYQWTPLHEAANNGDLHIVKLLLKYKADPNKKDWLKGSSAMHYAASEGHAQVLRILLDAGGEYNICNNEGKHPLDVAVDQCKAILEKLDKLSKCTINKSESGNNNERKDSQTADDQKHCDNEHDKTYLEADDISILSDSSASSWPSLRAWQTGSNSSTGKNLALGQIQLSFEYNSKNRTLKIRVWKVMDLLFPPANASMISSIQVKSYLMPDKKRDSKRKSEEVHVYSKPDISNENVGENQNIFQPRNFSFIKALEYKKMTKDLVAERFVHIEVCVSHKYSRKSYVIATWNSPLSMAVKQLVKTKYSLNPRLSTELPSSMKVYGATQGNLAQVTQAYNSCSAPNSRAHSWSSLPSTSAERASSDSNLQVVQVETHKYVPSIEVSLPSEDEDAEALHQISVENSKDDNSTFIQMCSKKEAHKEALPTGIELQELDDVTIDTHCQGNEVTDSIVYLPKELADEAINSAGITNLIGSHSDKDETAQKRSKRFSFSRKSSDFKSKKSSVREKDRTSKRSSTHMNVEEMAPTPDSPAWDTYTEPLEMVPVEFELHELSKRLSADPSSVQIPMETRLEIIPKVHDSCQINTGSERSSRGKGKGKSSNKKFFHT